VASMARDVVNFLGAQCSCFSSVYMQITVMDSTPDKFMKIT